MLQLVRTIWARLLTTLRGVAGTLLGLGLALVVVLLFYNRLNRDVKEIMRATAQQEATKKDSTQAALRRDMRWHQQLVAIVAKVLSAKEAGTSVGAAGGADKNTPPETTQAPPAPLAAADTSSTPSAPLAIPPPATAIPEIVKWEDRLRQVVAAVMPWLVLLGAALIGWTSWYAWQTARQTVPIEPTYTDQDPELLRALLRAYAGHIGRALPTPRQVKRFASKARLQNHLLAPETGALAGPQRVAQILAFLLLLVLERQAGQENQHSTNRAEVLTAPPSGSGSNSPPTSSISSQPAASPLLRDLSQEIFCSRLKELFLVWHQARESEKAYQAFAAGFKASWQPPAYDSLAQELLLPPGQILLTQFCRLNTGLLM